MARVTLLTDFGTEDGYVAAMKGVLTGAVPHLWLDDVTHAIPPGDVAKASGVISRYWRRFPVGTIHLVVVDPGVGTSRRGLALCADGRYLVGPDNGVFTRVFQEAGELEVVAIRPASGPGESPSPTFHGRDWFAPAAALLADGAALRSLGDPVTDWLLLPAPAWTREGPWVVGTVVEVDHFGNLGTNLPVAAVKAAGEVEIGGRRAPYRRTYGEVPEGELLALTDSEGRVEVAVRNGSAAAVLGLGCGSPVRARLEGTAED